MKKSTSIRRQRFFTSVWSHTLIIFLALIWILPIVWVGINSFKNDPGLASATFFPSSFTLDYYVKLFTVTSSRKYVTWVINTIEIAVLNTLLTTFFTIITAYTLSRLRFKMRRPLMNISLILGMFPGFMAMVAVYFIINLMGLINNKFALLLVYVCGAGLGFFMSKGYFDTISSDIDDAAKIDGANQWTIFFKIFLPLAKPIIIYTALMAFMAPWNDFILAGLILRDPSEMTVAVGLYAMVETPRGIVENFTMFAGGCILIAIPIIILYLALQRFMVEGISAGAVKG
ncbi:MAG: ABC transporter permease subunit [Bacilli bacterium]|jgi:arabinogalactan oligomer/maltooligosaccharide transport system permease protein|nr:ABC transporter permease subunit [Bacilli bacterium]